MMGWDAMVLVPILVLGIGVGIGIGLVFRAITPPQRVEPKTQIITKENP